MINELIGKTLLSIVPLKADGDIVEMLFICGTGEQYIMYHDYDCCERVRVEDIEGDLTDLYNYPITMAEESTNREDTFGKIESPESFTWTFYRFATVKGYVTIRWLGESNGYYGESVEFKRIDKK